MLELINKLKEFKAADDSAKEMEETIKEAIEQLQEKDKIINDMAKKINEAYFEENDFALWYEEYICEVQEKEDYSYLEPIIIEYFTKKAREV